MEPNLVPNKLSFDSTNRSNCDKRNLLSDLVTTAIPGAQVVLQAPRLVKLATILAGAVHDSFRHLWVLPKEAFMSDLKGEEEDLAATIMLVLKNFTELLSS